VPTNNFYQGFSQALFFSGSVSVPCFLLDHYHKLGISDREMMLLIHNLNEASGHTDHKEMQKMILKKMGISSAEFNDLTESLQSKGLLAINTDAKGKGTQHDFLYDLSGLIDQLIELWAIDRFRKIGKTQTPESVKITAVFEEELGRPLTAFECEHIEKWLLASYSEELIIEALRRGVSAGIRNFRYLDSILREWEKKGIRTKMEVETEDQHFQARQAKKAEKATKPKSSGKSKYDDIYL
jgi:DNA replication protein